MPFGLKNAPQIYQRLVDNALYGFVKIISYLEIIDTNVSHTMDVFQYGEPGTDQKPSRLGRRSYIDHIIIPVTTWESLYDKVERLLKACNTWNLSISLTKSFWGQKKVEVFKASIACVALL